MLYNLPNNCISLPSTHVLSPRFYSTSPDMPSRESFYLPTYSSTFTSFPPILKHHLANSNSVTTIQMHHKSQNAICLRAFDWTIGRFNLSLKQLSTSLQLWKSDSLSATQVSDVFIRLATDFNAVVAAFASYEISVSEFSSFEKRLRGVLEPCLNDSPSSSSFHRCVSDLEAVLEDVLPRLAVKHAEVKRILG